MTHKLYYCTICKSEDVFTVRSFEMESIIHPIQKELKETIVPCAFGCMHTGNNVFQNYSFNELLLGS